MDISSEDMDILSGSLPFGFRNVPVRLAANDYPSVQIVVLMNTCFKCAAHPRRNNFDMYTSSKQTNQLPSNGV